MRPIVKVLLVTLFLLMSAIQVSSEEYAWLYYHNWTDEDLHVYIDGKDYGIASKGIPNWWCLSEGPHRVESYRVSNPWKSSCHCAWVACSPRGDVTVDQSRHLNRSISSML